MSRRGGAGARRVCHLRAGPLPGPGHAELRQLPRQLRHLLRAADVSELRAGPGGGGGHGALLPPALGPAPPAAAPRDHPLAAGYSICNTT